MKEYVITQIEECSECKGKYSEIRESIPDRRGITFPEVWNCSYCHEGKVRTPISLEDAILDLLNSSSKVSACVYRMYP